MTAFKILVTSQKGGVGKSTLSANLSVYLQRQNQQVTHLDYDTHGSSSKWLSRAPQTGVVVQHHPLPLSQGGNYPLLDARLHLRRAANSSDIVVCDLTWSDNIGGELMFEYDLVIVPTSVSEIEVSATAEFLSHHHWVFHSSIHTPPTLLLSPTRVRPEQLEIDTFSQQRFPTSFMLTPPILESQSACELYESGYLTDLQDPCGQSFNAFGQAVCAAQQLRQHQNQTRQTLRKHSHRPSSLNNKLMARQSVLNRHQLHHSTAVQHIEEATQHKHISRIPSFLRRLGFS